MSSFHVRVSIEDSQAINKRKRDREDRGKRPMSDTRRYHLRNSRGGVRAPLTRVARKNSAGREIRWRRKREA